MKTISAAFVAAQKSFAPALKQSINPHFKSRYVDLAGCVEAVIDALNSNGIALQQHLSQSDTGVIVETVFIHESGERMECGKVHIPASKHDAQGFGSALTYARRYSLMAACGIAPEDDDGQAASKKSPSPVKAALESAIINPEDVAYLKELAAEVVELVEGQSNVIGGYDLLENAKLDNDQKLFVWDVLKPNSKTRSAIEAERKIRNPPKGASK
jgi:hypothetical protein